MAIFSGMGFIIKKIVVHKKPTDVREGEVHYNMDRTTWDVRNLLEVFSREFTHKDFCLAHLFTDIKFEGRLFLLSGLHEYGWHFSRILISREKREILSHFSRETRKKVPNFMECVKNTSKKLCLLMIRI